MRTPPVLFGLVSLGWLAFGVDSHVAAVGVEEILSRGGITRGIVALAGAADATLPIALAKHSELTVFVQARNPAAATQIRSLAYQAGLYGTRIFVDDLMDHRIALADNVADVAVPLDAAAGFAEEELRRIVRPGGKVLLADRQWIKPFPPGGDSWTHHYHGPDNNPQSHDTLARAPYLLQFVAEPRYAPGPQIAVSAAGRLFVGFGHFAWHEREEAWLNTLLAVNAFNGTHLWQRPLSPGIMIDRSTLVATPEVLYLADQESCKRLDAASGRLLDEIIPPAEITRDRFWKWMALEDGVLYAAIGDAEPPDPVAKWKSTNHGWPWTGISQGYNAADYRWGFAKTLLAIDPRTKKILWHEQEDPPLDSRSLCMKGGRIYYTSFGRYLTCRDARTGQSLWRRTAEKDPAVFAAIGPYRPEHGYIGGWKSTVYMKCTEKALYVVGPQVHWLTALSAADGRLLWKYPAKDLQIVIRDDGLYAIGPQNSNKEATKKLDPLTGEVLASYPTQRRACTRSTGVCDGIFFRGFEGSGRLDLASGAMQWVSPMRPSCQVGVLVADGNLFWIPWVCDCDLQLFGLIACGAAGDFRFDQSACDADRLETFDPPAGRSPPALSADDWPAYRANSQRTAVTEATISEQIKLRWMQPFSPKLELTAPVAAGGRVWVADSAGAVHALRASDGTEQVTAYTGGAVSFPPTILHDRALAGSADGCVYAFDTATGHRLWRFRAAPSPRRIPMYGALVSSWPVNSGVLVDGDVAYAAAGITDFGGTHVFALEAASGRIRWQNHAAGHLDDVSRRGVACQGELLLADGRLYLAGGNAVSPGVFEAASGRLLSDPPHNNGSQAIRGRELTLVGQRVDVSGQPLYSQPGFPVYGGPQTQWKPMVVLAKNAKLRLSPVKQQSRTVWQLVAERLSDGAALWTFPLPAEPVRWGIAVDAEGNVVLVLRDGKVMELGKG